MSFSKQFDKDKATVKQLKHRTNRSDRWSIAEKQTDDEFKNIESFQGTKFLEKSDLVDISVKFDLLSETELYELIWHLCVTAKMYQTEFIKILKRLIALDKLAVFEK